VSSLLNLSKWKLREAIFYQRVLNKGISLPVYIKRLFEQGYLPKVLQSHLDLYPYTERFFQFLDWPLNSWYAKGVYDDLLAMKKKKNAIVPHEQIEKCAN
jgi:hypothetical protein